MPRTTVTLPEETANTLTAALGEPNLAKAITQAVENQVWRSTMAEHDRWLRAHPQIAAQLNDAAAAIRAGRGQ
jgi:hypothetical protein